MAGVGATNRTERTHGSRNARIEPDKPMNAQVILRWVCLAALVVTGCQSDPSRTHDTGLLDDKVTAERVAAALQREGPEFRAVKIDTLKGVVTLSGTVPTSDGRTRAESLARNVDGVTKVNDRIELRR